MVKYCKNAKVKRWLMILSLTLYAENVLDLMGQFLQFYSKILLSVYIFGSEKEQSHLTRVRSSLQWKTFTFDGFSLKLFLKCLCVCVGEMPFLP